MNAAIDHTFYRNKEEWKDVVPIKQQEEKTSVKINYSDKFVDVYDYIRAVMVADEHSERALKLTEDALILNPANYSVWYYRRNILSSLNSDLEEELKFVAECIEDNQKNYQVWYHRQWIVEQLSMKSTDNDEKQQELLVQELLFTEAYLNDDSKNYHVWQYRHWIVRHFKVFEYELEFCDKLLTSDLYNNSAWNHRYYVIKELSGFTELVLDQETDYAMKYIRQAPENESSWNYLVGIYSEKSLSQYANLESFCKTLLADEKSAQSPYLNSFYLDILLDKIKCFDIINYEGDVTRSSLIKEACDICCNLADKIDKIRVNYWKYRLQTIIDENVK